MKYGATAAVFFYGVNQKRLTSCMDTGYGHLQNDSKTKSKDNGLAYSQAEWLQSVNRCKMFRTTIFANGLTGQKPERYERRAGKR